MPVERSINTTNGEQFEASSPMEVVHIQPASILLCVCPLERAACGDGNSLLCRAEW